MSGKRLRVTASELNVRTGPAKEYPEMALLKRGDVVEESEIGAWRPVRLPDGREGWVHGDYVTEAKETTMEAIPTPYTKARPNFNDLREARIGIMLHYDASTGSDGSALSWFSDPACQVSYNILVGDDGKAWSIAPEDKRAWHAGLCRSSNPAQLPYKDANSAFYGISWAGGGKSTDRCPVAAVASIAAHCTRLFRKYGWKANETWRIVGHRTEAWPRGRKADPEGLNLARPILSTDDVRKRVAVLLG